LSRESNHQVSRKRGASKERGAMAEPPAKRARRTDSTAMWDRNERSSRPPTDREHDRDVKAPAASRDRRDERDRRYRSRSRERAEKRRERSRSRERDGERHREGDRGRDDRGARERDRPRPRKDEPLRSDRQHTRSRSPARNGTSARLRSPPRRPRVDGQRDVPPPSKVSQPVAAPATVPKIEPDKMQIDAGTTNGAKASVKEEEDSDPEVALMRKMMGFAGFKSTKNTKVPGNDIYAVRKEKTTEYRQYMNRIGGFNRALSPG